ncbi:hypothetical protein LQW54_009358 [Pestalotiopsis sp. IQ-011]
MGITSGFDMVPRLSRGTGDCLKWDYFIELIRQFYDTDEQVQIDEHAIRFKAGEHPLLPLEGHKFLRFSSKLSGSIAGETGVETYIRGVAFIAKKLFGARVHSWDEFLEQGGFYDWRSVRASINSYNQGASEAEPSPSDDIITTRYAEDMDLYGVVEISGRGKGLVAKVGIPRGTRVLCEKPLFTVDHMPPHLLHKTVATKLKTLSKDEQRQFLSLHNNFPGQHAFNGIVRTNALPCGPESRVGGIYPKICLINHSCIPNAHNNWNTEALHETIHALRDISAGEEIMISYDMSLPSTARWAKLKDSFGFQCSCELCTLPAEEIDLSDARRLQIADLDGMIGNPTAMVLNPLKSLAACHELLQVLNREYGEAATALLARLYYDAFQITAAHGDQARASAFAEHAYMARVVCEGEDSPVTRKAKTLMQDPTRHASFGTYSKKWKSTKTAIAKELDEPSFEKWLWRLPN